MPVKRTHHQVTSDQRLKILSRQLYGKEQTLKTTSYEIPKPNAQSSDLIYLKQDLVKITILASLAFGAEFALYFGSIHKLIKLPI